MRLVGEKKMADELYYRGSSSYEVAVKNKLDTLERSGVRNATAILSGLQNVEYGIKNEIRESTYQILASQEYLAETYQKGFSSVNNTLQVGFDKMFQGMSDINDSINAMSEAICDRLDAIHDIVNNPRLTAARELFRSASKNFEKGYFEEALSDCKQAVEKEKTDYLSWYLLGQIYLFGAGKFSNVINLKEAETAFENAAKYIDSDLNSSDDAKELGSQIYYHLGYTRWLLSNDLLIEEKIDESNTKLGEAQKNSAEASRLSKKNLKARYDNAKQLHFLGKDSEALAVLKDLIRDEKNYALLSCNDKNFESIWSDIEKAILELRDEIIPKCYSKLKEIKNSYEGIKDVSMYEKVIDSLKNKDFCTVSTFFKEGLDSIKIELINSADALYFVEFISEIFSAVSKVKNLSGFFSSNKCNKDSFMSLDDTWQCSLVNGDISNYDDDYYSSIKLAGDEYFKTNAKKIFEKTKAIFKRFAKTHEELFSKKDYFNLTKCVVYETKSYSFIDSFFRKLYGNGKNPAIIKILDDIKNLSKKSDEATQELSYEKYVNSDDVQIVGYEHHTAEWHYIKCENDSTLKKVAIEEGEEELWSKTFYNCENLEEVYLPKSVTKIKYNAFYNCPKLRFINISDNVVIKNKAFLNCGELLKNEEIASKIKASNPKAFGSGCYVATCVYGSYDCPQVWTLRRFRDNTLGSTWYGRLFIKTYYAVSPTLVKWFGKTAWFKNMWKPTLDKMVSKLQANGVESTPYEDKMWR